MMARTAVGLGEVIGRVQGRVFGLERGDGCALSGLATGDSNKAAWR